MTRTSTNRAEMAYNARWYLSANIIGHIYVVLTIPVLSAYLSVQEFGFYVLIAQLVSVLQMVGMVFFSQTLLRFHVDWSGEARRVFLGTLLISVVVFETALASALYVGREYLLPLVYPNINLPLDPHVGWACAWLVLASLRTLTLTKIKAEERPVWALKINVIYGAFLVTAMVGLIVYKGGGLAEGLASFVLAEAATFVCAGLWIWRDAKLTWRFEILKRVVVFSFPLACSSILFIFAANMDRKVLSEYVTLEDMGIYGIGFLIGNSVALIVSSYASAFTTRALRVYKNEGGIALGKLIQGGMEDCSTGVVVAWSGVVILGSYAAALLNQSGTSGPVVAVAAGVAGGHAARSVYLFAQNVLFIGSRTDVILLLNVGLVIATWLLAHGLACVGGIAGVALSTACSYLIIMPLAMLAARRISSLVIPWSFLGRLSLGIATISILEFGVIKLMPTGILFDLLRKGLQASILLFILRHKIYNSGKFPLLQKFGW